MDTALRGAIAAGAGRPLSAVVLLTDGRSPDPVAPETVQRLLEEIHKLSGHIPEGGRVIGLSSDAAVEAYPGWGGYGAYAYFEFTDANGNNIYEEGEEYAFLFGNGFDLDNPSSSGNTVDPGLDPEMVSEFILGAEHSLMIGSAGAGTVTSADTGARNGSSAPGYSTVKTPTSSASGVP